MPRTSKGTRRNRKHKPTDLPAKFKTGFLAALDKRTDLAKTLRANYDAIVEDIGGDPQVGHIKGALVERFVWLEGILQTIEHEMATGECDRTEAIGKWIAAVNALTGLAKTLGIERSNRVSWTLPPANGNGSEAHDD